MKNIDMHRDADGDQERPQPHVNVGTMGRKPNLASMLLLAACASTGADLFRDPRENRRTVSRILTKGKETAKELARTQKPGGGKGAKIRRAENRKRVEVLPLYDLRNMRLQNEWEYRTPDDKCHPTMDAALAHMEASR